MEKHIGEIKHELQEVEAHIDKLVGIGYSNRTQQETVVLGALLALRDGLCKYKYAKMKHDKHDDDHDERVEIRARR